MPSMRMAPRRRGWVTALLTVLAVLLFALERLVVDDLRALGRWLARRDWVARAEAWVGRLSPYPALLCFALPGYDPITNTQAPRQRGKLKDIRGWWPAQPDSTTKRSTTKKTRQVEVPASATSCQLCGKFRSDR